MKSIKIIILILTVIQLLYPVQALDDEYDDEIDTYEEVKPVIHQIDKTALYIQQQAKNFKRPKEKKSDAGEDGEKEEKDGDE